MKKCLFTCYNFQIDPRYEKYHRLVIERLCPPDVDYVPLRYHLRDDQMIHWEVLDYALKQLFYEQKFDRVMVLDVDCIPLSTFAIDYCFEKAAQNIFLGNIQRSNHIDNNEHCYVASSCFTLHRDLFEKIGSPSTCPTDRADTVEEFTYRCEENSYPVESFLPQSYEALPFQSATPWELKKGMPSYGIGTTFINQHQQPMFYHLFEARYPGHAQRFIKQCKMILEKP